MQRLKSIPQERIPRGVPGNERIGAFTDGVFAVAITLLVLEIHIPDLASTLSPDEVAQALMHDLQQLLPNILGHVVSFAVIGIYWVGHHNMFLHIKRHDRMLLWLNILFLMFVAFMPFPTGLLIRYSDQRLPVIIYAASLVLTGFSLDLIWWYASTNYRLVDKHMDPDLIMFVHRRVLLAPMIYLLAIGISFFSPMVSRLLFAVVAVVYVVPSPLDRYHHKQLGTTE